MSVLAFACGRDAGSRMLNLVCFEIRLVGGGLFTGRYRSLQDENEAGSRFDPNTGQGKVCIPRPLVLAASCR